MKKQYILVIDSGVGGVAILKELIKKYPLENFIYLADNKSSPYGNKTKAFMIGNIIKIINEYMSKYFIKLIIFACNTLTATTIDYVRSRIVCKIVGTEPPIKMICNNEKTLLLATEGTIKNSTLLKNYKRGKNITMVALKDIASLLDNNFFNRQEITKQLKNQIPQNNYKNVVLGCTHYYFLKDEIKTVLNNKNIEFYDATLGVLNRVDCLLTKNCYNKKQSVKIHTTKNDIKLKKTIKFILNN